MRWIVIFMLIIATGCSSKIEPLTPQPVEKLNPNISIGDLTEGEITDELVIQGSVTTSDSCGNFYQTLMVQDETGAIALQFNFYDSYSLFKRGDVISVKLKDKILKLENGVLCINIGTPYMATKLVKRQGIISPIEPQEIRIQEITAQHAGLLVKITGGAFANGEKTTWNGEQKYVLGKNSIVVYTSQFASFANKTLPLGTVSLTGIVTMYKDKIQLKLSSDKDCTAE